MPEKGQEVFGGNNAAFAHWVAEQGRVLWRHVSRESNHSVHTSPGASWKYVKLLVSTNRPLLS